MSKEDIAKGANWFGSISAAISDSDFCLVVLTSANQMNQWVMFEAGAATNRMTRERVSAVLLDLEPDEVRGPLGQFQHVLPSEVDFRRLVSTLNDLLGEDALAPDRLDRAFETHWPRLHGELTAAAGLVDQDHDDADEQDLLTEVLAISRSNAAALSDLSRRLPRTVGIAGLLSGEPSVRSELPPWLEKGGHEELLDSVSISDVLAARKRHAASADASDDTEPGAARRESHSDQPEEHDGS